MAMAHFPQTAPTSCMLQVDVQCFKLVKQQAGAEENSYNSATCCRNKCGAAITEPRAVTQTTVDSKELINLQ